MDSTMNEFLKPNSVMSMNFDELLNLEHPLNSNDSINYNKTSNHFHIDWQQHCWNAYYDSYENFDYQYQLQTPAPLMPSETELPTTSAQSFSAYQEIIPTVSVLPRVTETEFLSGTISPSPSISPNPEQGKRKRTVFTENQRFVLQNEFAKNPYTGTARRHIIANRLGVEERAIKTWFQNRRTKQKKALYMSNDNNDDQLVSKKLNKDMENNLLTYKKQTDEQQQQQQSQLSYINAEQQIQQIEDENSLSDVEECLMKESCFGGPETTTLTSINRSDWLNIEEIIQPIKMSLELEAFKFLNGIQSELPLTMNMQPIDNTYNNYYYTG